MSFPAIAACFHAYGSYAQPKLLVHRLGSEFDILPDGHQALAAGYPIQAPLDALSNLIAAHRIAAADVERVLVAIDEQGARTVNKRRMASINIQHLMAMMLVDGEITSLRPTTANAWAIRRWSV